MQQVRYGTHEQNRATPSHYNGAGIDGREKWEWCMCTSYTAAHTQRATDEQQPDQSDGKARLTQQCGQLSKGDADACGFGGCADGCGDGFGSEIRRRLNPHEPCNRNE